jgi:hypothetical protein
VRHAIPRTRLAELRFAADEDAEHFDWRCTTEDVRTETQCLSSLIHE